MHSFDRSAARRHGRRRAARALAAGLAWAAGAGVMAQPVPETPAAAAPVPRAFGLSTGITFEASVLQVTERATGNGTEALLRASPSVTMAHRGGRLQGSLIYSGALTTRHGIDDRQENDYTNTLSAAYVLEAIEGIGFVDARAGITQRSISAVGAPTGSLGTSANRAESRTVSLSPYLRGPLAGFAEYELRAGATATRSDRDTATDSDVGHASFTLRSPRRGAVFGWGLSGTRQRVKFLVSAAPTVSDRLSAELAFQPDVDLRLTATGGVERTDVVGAVRREYENYGAGLEWTPSPRTTVALQGEERYFGRARRATVAHRFARSTFRLTSSRDLSVGSDTLSRRATATLYEQYFEQYAALIPDPVQRDLFVLALIAATGRDRNELISGGAFGGSGIAVENRHELLWTWAGPRLTLSTSAYSVQTERVDTGGVNPASRNDNIQSNGYAAGLGWRLTPRTSISASGSRTMSKDIVTLVRSDLKSVSLGITSRLGERATGALSTRYSVLNGPTAYRETALTGSLSLRF